MQQEPLVDHHRRQVPLAQCRHMGRMPTSSVGSRPLPSSRYADSSNAADDDNYCESDTDSSFSLVSDGADLDGAKAFVSGLYRNQQWEHPTQATGRGTKDPHACHGLANLPGRYLGGHMVEWEKWRQSPARDIVEWESPGHDRPKDPLL